jgi:hypothetical protein
MSYYSAPFTFDFGQSMIDVNNGVVDVDCAELYRALRLAQASEEGIIHEPIGKGSGLNVLGPGVQVGLTVALLGAWQLRFPAGDYVVRIAGGNLISEGTGDPIAYTPGVQAVLIQSAASTVVTADGGSLAPTVPQIVAGLRPGLETINDGVKKASTLVPHTTDLP